MEGVCDNLVTGPRKAELLKDVINQPIKAIGAFSTAASVFHSQKKKMEFKSGKLVCKPGLED